MAAISMAIVVVVYLSIYVHARSTKNCECMYVAVTQAPCSESFSYRSDE